MRSAWASVMDAEKPFSAWENTRRTLPPYWVASS